VIAAARAQLLRAATNAAVAVALLLAAAKITVFFFSGSVALLASALDSALDGSASLLNALAVRYALRPPDSDHRFGHGKSEALAGVAQALFITGSGVFVIVRAVVRLLHPEPLSAALPAVLVMVASLVLTLGLVTFQSRVVARTGSAAVRADALHYASDVASNTAALLALLLARAGLERADPLFGLLIALVTLYGAWRIGVDAFSVLMDHELPANLRQQIERIVLAHAQVRGIHALRTRMSGSTPLIQFHIELDPAISLVDANRIAHDVEAAVNDAFPEADVTIHQDPFGQPCHRQRD
jgi:ferrous-iron efflux pump FieF